jgi:predicted nucleic acid-binding protein
VTYLLDTNVISELIRPRPEPLVVGWLADVDEDRVFLSVVTLAELEKGVRLLADGQKRQRLEQWLENDLAQRFEGRVLDITPEIARQWGSVTAARQRAGRPMAMLDAFLVATALQRAFTLVTRNDRDFADTGVDVLNPWSQS